MSDRKKILSATLPHYRYIRKMRRGDRLPLTQIQHWRTERTLC